MKSSIKKGRSPLVQSEQEGKGKCLPRCMRGEEKKILFPSISPPSLKNSALCAVNVEVAQEEEKGENGSLNI